MDCGQRNTKKSSFIFPDWRRGRMKRTDRSSNIELLRIVAMYMMIIHHGITYSGIMGNCSVVNDQIAGVLLIGINKKNK